ncbi:MAG: ArsR/SmtB family transcription factor [Candidatus Dormibacteria bacterium]
MSSSSPEIAPEAAELLRLLADPTRRRIFLLVMEGEICNCELSESLNLPQNLASHHLRRLREAGLVEEHRDPHDGRWAHCTVNAEALARAWEGLEAAIHPSRIGERVPACRVRSEKAALAAAVGGSPEGRKRS